MNNTTATIFSGSEYTISDEISANFFGGNHLFKSDYSDGTFVDKVDYLNVNMLRYPGGEMTETLFDVNNPDYVPAGEQRETLSEFLSYVGKNGITPVIVIPIKHYVNDGVPIDQAVAEISNFIQRVTSGEFGDVKIDTFEIGNEFSWNDNAITGTQYGAYASAFAVAIKEVSSYDVEVAVQSGTHWGQESVAIELNNQIMAEFDNAGAFWAVDKLVAHIYPENFTSIANNLSAALPDQVIRDWETATGRELDLFISEWNTFVDHSPLFDQYYGLAHAHSIIEMVSEMTKKGVDMGAVWAIQHNTRTELAGREGDNEIRIAGEIFHMLSESTVGTKALDIPIDVVGDGQVVLHAFESDSKIVIFLSALDIVDNTSPFTVDLNIESLGSGFRYIWGEKLSTDNPDIFHPNASPLVTTFFPSMDIVNDTTNIEVTFNGDYEVIKLVLLKDSIGDTPLHVVGGDIDDIFRTGHGDDQIEGHDGNDVIFGMKGSDSISGGSGHDTIRGGDGNDSISAGLGDDFVRGGPGDDNIEGSGGSDDLGGGKGDDELLGGGGADYIKGGEGNDTIDGNLGNDVLGGGKGNDTLFGSQGEDLLKGGPGNDYLYGGSEDDILRGSFGDDLIVGGEGNDILWGGEGLDTFVFSASSGQDKIKDFETSIDKLDLGFMAFKNISQTILDRGVLIEFDGGSALVQDYFSIIPESDFLVL